MIPPRLHLVTDDQVLRQPDFVARATAVMEACGGRVAVHVRGHGLSGGELYGITAALRAARPPAAAVLLANDRVDIALAAGLDGAQVGSRSIPVRSAREILGSEALIGYSAHETSELPAAIEADFVLLGTIYPSASHPERDAAGLELVLAATQATAQPIIAIGGVTPARVGELISAGAFGVAVLGGVWHATDPVSAADSYLDAIEAAIGGC